MEILAQKNRIQAVYKELSDNIASAQVIQNAILPGKDLIKKREIYQIMEVATDKCEDAGNVIESIVVKYA